jgi:hypothetical protein
MLCQGEEKLSFQSLPSTSPPTSGEGIEALLNLCVKNFDLERAKDNDFTTRKL